MSILNWSQAFYHWTVMQIFDNTTLPGSSQRCPDRLSIVRNLDLYNCNGQDAVLLTLESKRFYRVSQSGQNVLSMRIRSKILYFYGKLTSMESLDWVNRYKIFHPHLHKKNNTTQSNLSLINKTYHNITCWEYANVENVPHVLFLKIKNGS